MAYCPYTADWEPILHHEENKERSKPILGKRPRSPAEDGSDRPAKKLQQTSASTDLSPLLINFNSLSMPLLVS
jgi:hypothetical protein